MMEPNDKTRNMRFTSPAGESLLLTELRGFEGISKLYEFELKLQSPLSQPLNVFELVGSEVRVDIELPSPEWIQMEVDGQLPNARSRRFCGFIESATELYADDHFQYYQLSMRPRLWYLTQSSTCQIFQERAAPDILKSILQDIHAHYQLCNDYRRRPYCVQYNESMYEFACRIMEEEGIFFYFEHEYEGQDDEERLRGERLVVTDAVEDLPLIASDCNLATQQLYDCDGLVRYEPGEGGTRDELRITAWNLSQRIVSTKSIVRDQSFQLPDQTLEAEEEIPESVEVGERQFTLHRSPQSLERFEYPGGYAKHHDGIDPSGSDRSANMRRVFDENQETAKRRVDQQVWRAIDASGTSDCLHLKHGHKLNLLKDGQVIGPFVIRTIEHLAILNADVRSTQRSQELRYENHFSCFPDRLPYRPPPATPKPRIYGYQTATIVTPDEQELYSDRFGRFKVRFNWDRTDPHTTDLSCWVRVAQVWAGNRWGAFFWPRAGQEVVVAFEHGDPDCPLIVGSVYNAKNMPPFKLPDRLFSSGIKSCSIDGNPLENFNCVIFHDKPGIEYLQLHSETHECLTSECGKLSSSSGPSVSFKGAGSGIPKTHGSGAGGGPKSTSQLSPTLDFGQNCSSYESEVAGKRQRLEALLDLQVQQAINYLKANGSGAGGLIAGLLEGQGVVPTRSQAGFEAEEIAEVGNLQGGYELTSGNSQESFLGGETKRIFGRKLDVNANVEGLIDSILMNMMSSAFVGNKLDPQKWSTTSELSQVYGNRTEVTYGHKFEIHRGSETKVTEEAFFSMPSPVNGPTYAFAQRRNVSIAVKVLAILILLLDLAMTIAIKVEMESPPEVDEEDEDGNPRSKEEIEEQYQPWKETIGKMSRWSAFCETILLKVETMLEKLYAELTSIEATTRGLESDVADVTILTIRMSTWSNPRPVIAARMRRAGMFLRRNSENILGIAAVLFFLGIGIAAAVTTHQEQ
jgi:type VI secretion system VgrG family protein